MITFTLLSWASVPLFLNYFSKVLHLDPFSANGWRYAISAAFWLPVLVMTYRAGKLPKKLFVLAIVPTLFNIAGQTTFAWGPALLDPGFFSFVFRVQIVFATLGAYLLFPSERKTLLSPRFWLGIGLVVIGSAGLILTKDSIASAAAPTTLGVCVAILSGLLFTGYGLGVRYYVGDVAPITAFGVICQFTAVGMVAIAFIAPSLAGSLPEAIPTPDPFLPVKAFDAWAWALLVASAFIGIAISHVTYYASMKRLGVSVSIGIIQLQPIFTAVGSMLLFGEKLNTSQWGFGLVGVVGAMLMLWAGSMRTRKDKAEMNVSPTAVAAAGEEGS